MADENVNNTSITKSDIADIIKTGKLPCSFPKDSVKITYNVLSDIFVVIEESEYFDSGNLIPCLSLLCGWDVSAVVGKLRHPTLLEK